MPDGDNPLLQFLSADRLKSVPASDAPTAGPTNSPDLAPLSRQAAASTAAINSSPASVSIQGNLNWFDRNQRTDEQGRTIPIDVSSGVDLKDFARMVWQRRPEDRVAVLQKIFPFSLVREADTGDLIVEVKKPGEPTHDALVSPMGFNLNDAIQTVEQAAGPTLIGAAGMAAGEALGSRVGGPPGGAVGKVLGAAIGTGIGGAITDITARKAEGLPLDMGEIAKEQSKQAALNGLFDVGLYGGAKALRAFSPFATSRGPLQFKLAEAKDYFEKNYGVKFETTPAEESGAPLLGRLERTESQLPGSAGVLGGIYDKTQKDLSSIFDAATGGRLTDEQLGQSIVPTVKAALVDPVEQAVQIASTRLRDKGESEIADVLDDLAPSPTTRRIAGETARTDFKAARDAAKVETDTAYEAVRSIPGGDSKILPGNSVADAADSIYSELPKVLKTKVVPSFDSYGNPIAKTVVRRELLKSGVPEGLLSFLEDMKALRGQKMSIDELTLLKNRARDEIAKTEAVPGVKDRWFNIIASAYDKAVTTGVDGISDPSLKNALVHAKETYKQRLLPFDREGLHDILRTEYEGGFQSPEQLVNRLFSGERADYNYRTLKDTLGSGSNAFQQIRRAVVESWRSSAVDPITQRVNPAKFESRLLALREAHPEIYSDVVGSSEKKLFQATAAMRLSRTEISDIDPEEFAALMRGGNPTRQDIVRLMDAQKVRDATLANTYLKSLASGRTTGSVTPAEFVSSLFNAKIDNGHLSDVLGSLGKTQIEDLQRAALYRVITKASDSKIDMARYLSGTQSPFQAHAMAKALGPIGSDELARNQILLGPQYRDLVENAMAILAPREEKTGLFKAAGSMAATGMLEKLLKLPLQYMEQWAKKSVAATLYTSDAFKGALINTQFGPKETAAYANALIASEPFIKEMARTYGHNAAFSIALDAKHSIDQFVRQNSQPTKGEAQQNELMRFLQTNKGKVKLNPR